MTDSIHTATTDKKWFLVRCKSKQEQRASVNFSNQSITSYFPTVDVIKVVRGKKQTKQEALFPGYLFVHLDLLSGAASKVNYTFGVYGFVKFAGNPQQVPDELIAELKTLESQTIDTSLQAGEQVTINNDQYKNIRAIFLEAESEKRSILLVELLNQQVKLSVENSDITPVLS